MLTCVSESVRSLCREIDAAGLKRPSWAPGIKPRPGLSGPLWDIVPEETRKKITTMLIDVTKALEGSYSTYLEPDFVKSKEKILDTIKGFGVPDEVIAWFKGQLERAKNFNELTHLFGEFHRKLSEPSYPAVPHKP